MKPMIEILKLVRAHMDVERDYYGMCGTAHELWVKDKLYTNERLAFLQYIKLHKPKPKKPHLEHYEMYFFRPKDKRPRRKFLDRLIKQLEEEQNGN